MTKNLCKRLALLLVIILVLLLPLLTSEDYLLTILDLIGIYVILASSLNLLVGYTGQLSFAHVAFYGIGAYTSTLLVTKWGWSFWLALPVAGLTAAIISFPIGAIALRFRKHVFVLVTLSLSEIIRLTIYNLNDLTGGPNGIFNIPRPENLNVFGLVWDLSSSKGIYLLIAIFAIFTVLIIKAIIESPMGLALKSIRENETYAAFSGINVRLYKNLAFAIGALFAGIAGSIYAHWIGYVSPHAFTSMESINILLMVYFGGVGTLLGPVIGSGLLVALPEVLRSISDYRMLVYGALLVLVISYMPNGLLGLISAIQRRSVRKGLAQIKKVRVEG